MSELWASSHVVVATGAVGCPPRYPIRGPLFYDAGCSVAHLSTEPEPTSGFGRTRGSSDTRMGEGQIWCSPSRSGSHTHVRPPFEFSSDLHILISRGGLQESEGRWIPTLSFEKQGIMQIWREALIAYLWEALKATELNVDLNRESVRAILKTQYGRNLEHLHRSLPVKITVLAICRPVHS